MKRSWSGPSSSSCRRPGSGVRTSSCIMLWSGSGLYPAIIPGSGLGLPSMKFNVLTTSFILPRSGLSYHLYHGNYRVRIPPLFVKVRVPNTTFIMPRSESGVPSLSFQGQDQNFLFQHAKVRISMPRSRRSGLLPSSCQGQRQDYLLIIPKVKEVRITSFNMPKSESGLPSFFIMPRLVLGLRSGLSPSWCQQKGQDYLLHHDKFIGRASSLIIPRSQTELHVNVRDYLLHHAKLWTWYPSHGPKVRFKYYFTSHTKVRSGLPHSWCQD